MHGFLCPPIKYIYYSKLFTAQAMQETRGNVAETAQAGNELNPPPCDLR